MRKKRADTLLDTHAGPVNVLSLRFEKHDMKARNCMTTKEAERVMTRGVNSKVNLFNKILNTR